MDFGALLHVAKKNSENAETGLRCYSTKFAPPKKENKDKKLSANIQKFLAKKEEEEREKARQIREKREQLNAARDMKSKNKINKMLKVIKSANKSVLDDAVDNSNTAVTLVGPEQPDEDDYGYVSQESCAFYKKLMDKFKNSPEEQKFAKSLKPRAMTNESMKNTTNRVKEALTMDKDKPRQAHKVVQKPSNLNNSSKQEPVVPEKPKPTQRRPPPPPVDFNQLLKMAEKKQFEPIKVHQETKKDERPMTMKEKREFEERQKLAMERKKRLECDNYDYRKSTNLPPPSAASSSASAKPPNNSMRIPKLNESSKPGPSKPDQPPVYKASPIPAKPQQNGASTSKAAPAIKQAKDRPEYTARPIPKEVKAEKQRPQMPEKSRQPPPADVQRQKQFPPADVRRKKPFPSPERRRPFPSPERRRPFPSPDRRNMGRNMDRMPAKRPRIEDDYDSEEEEYDSEMDDFIDDGPQEGDVSGFIKEIFGYDRRRFRDEDDDCADMESNFVDQMREEARSLKIGIMEDLEDMRMEEEEKARKAAMKKKQMRRK